MLWMFFVQYCGHFEQYPDMGVVLINSLLFGLLTSGENFAVIFMFAACAVRADAPITKLAIISNIDRYFFITNLLMVDFVCKYNIPAVTF